MTSLVAICGYATAGKDAAARALTDVGWERRAFADALRALALDIDPWVIAGPLAGVETPAGPVRPFVRLSWLWEHVGYEASKAAPEVREFLQRLGHSARTRLGRDVWIDAALRCVAADARVVLSDCRYWNEAEAIRDLGGIIVRVERPGVGPANGHVSETDLNLFDVDHVVSNSGTLEHLAAVMRGIVACDAAT